MSLNEDIKDVLTNNSRAVAIRWYQTFKIAANQGYVLAGLPTRTTFDNLYVSTYANTKEPSV